MHRPQVRRFLAVLLVGTLIVLATLAPLSSAVGTHPGLQGQAQDYPARLGYGAFLLVLMLTVPALILGAFWWLPARAPRLLSIPHADYWLAPERSARTREFLIDHGSRMGMLTVLLVAGMHLIVFMAHAVVPPRLPVLPFAVLMFLYCTGLSLWLMRFYKEFRLPGEGNR